MFNEYYQIDRNSYKHVYSIFSVVECAPPVNISNASYQPVQSIYNYSTVVSYACDNGYYLSSGNLTAQCDETKSWIGSSPVCSSKLVIVDVLIWSS